MCTQKGSLLLLQQGIGQHATYQLELLLAHRTALEQWYQCFEVELDGLESEIGALESLKITYTRHPSLFSNYSRSSRSRKSPEELSGLRLTRYAKLSKTI